MAIKSWKLPSHRVAVVVFIIIFFDLFFSSTKAVASIEFLICSRTNGLFTNRGQRQRIFKNYARDKFSRK